MLFRSSIAHLYNGDLLKGWEKYDARWYYETGSNIKPDLPGPEYNGSQSLIDKIILVYCEQGFGDCIQFSRYILLLEKMAKKVIFVSKPKLVSLFKRNFPNCQIVSQNDGIPAYNYHVALLDLPKCFNTTIDSIPYPISFLSVDEGLKAQWKKILGPKTKLRIGILLSSNSIAYITKFRSVKVESMIDIFDSNFEFVNLSIDSSDEDKKIFEEYASRFIGEYDWIFYVTPSGVKLEDNDVRTTDADYRLIIDNTIRFLCSNNLHKIRNFGIISGTNEDRLKQIRSYLNL